MIKARDIDADTSQGPHANAGDEGVVGAGGGTLRGKAQVGSYSTTPAHQLHKAVVGSRVVDIDTRTGGLKYGAMPSDYFAPETPMGASRHAIPKLDVDRKAGTVQLDKHVTSSVYLGDLTQYWKSENPYQTTAMAAAQHVAPGQRDRMPAASSEWQHFKPASNGPTQAQSGPRNPRLLTVEPIRKNANKDARGGGGDGRCGRVSWNEADFGEALSPVAADISASK